MSEAMAHNTPPNFFSRFFPKDAPAPWHYAILYAFLFLWMQGEALLNILWALLLLTSLPYLHLGIERIRRYRWLWISITAYLGLRLLSVAYAIDTKYALYGITDDLRIFTVGLLLLTFIQNKEQLRNVIIATATGLGVLAWSAFVQHLFASYQLSLKSTVVDTWPAIILIPQSHIEFGSFAHVNYAATFTSVALFSLLVLSRHISFKWIMAIFIAALPMCILQAPLSSRTTLMLLAATILLYFIIKRPGWIATAVTGTIIAVALTLVINTYSHTHSGRQAITGLFSDPLHSGSVTTRIDIWNTLLQVWKDHPMGIGPRNFNVIDMNPYRDWIYENATNTAMAVYGKEAVDNKLQGLDLNEAGHFVTDPHSHYVSLFVENGPLGLLALLSYLLAAFVIAVRYSFCKNNWTSGFGEATAGGLVLMGGAGLMTAVFYQSGGIITVMLIAFLIASIDIHGTERKEETEG